MPSAARPSFHRIAGRMTRSLRIQQHGAVHLSCQTHASTAPSATASSAATAATRRAPPGVGILLRPQRLRMRHRKRRGRLADQRTGVVDQHRLDARCSEVDAEKHASGPARA